MGRVKAFGAILVLVALGAFVLFINNKAPAPPNYSAIQATVTTPTPPPVFFGGGGFSTHSQTNQTTDTDDENSTLIPPESSTLIMNFYVDHDGVLPVTNIEWGSIAPGGSADKLVYMRNDGNTSLKITGASIFNLICKDETGNTLKDRTYSPYFELTLDTVGVQLNPQDVAESKITLHIGIGIPSTVRTFSFTVTIGMSDV